MNLCGLRDELAQVLTKKKEFLETIDRTHLAVLFKPYDLELMQRIYLLQNFYNLSGMAMVAEVVDSRAFSCFCVVLP